MGDVRANGATSLADVVAATAGYRELIIEEMHRSLEDAFAGAQTATAVAASLEQLRGHIEYHLGWRQPDLSLANGHGGKLLRPLLTLLACEFAAGGADNRRQTHGQLMRQAAVAGTSIELAHNFSLVHDDIEDGDEQRRHRPTLWKLWGVPLSINTGDTILAIARLTLWRLIDAGRSPDVALQLAALIDRAILDMCDGQSLDLCFERRLDVSADMYMEMIRRKTSALMSCSAHMGALLGSDDRDLTTLLAEYGRRLGLAFQLRDDLLGIWATPDELGKVSAGDLRRKKVTLPLIYAVERATDADQRRLARIYAERGPATDQQIADMLEILEQTEAHTGVSSAMAEQVTAARRALDGAATRVDSRASSRAANPRAAHQLLASMLDAIARGS